MIRSLRDDDPVPEWEPRRYKNRQGYVRLRWKIGPNEFVEMYEHRYVTGAREGQQVHHINGIKDDNRPENLELISPSEHGHRHQPPHVPRAQLVELYEAGFSTPEIGRIVGLNAATVFRALVARGVQTRPMGGHNALPLDLDLIRELKQQGRSNRSIAREFGCSSYAIDTRVKAMAL